MPHKVTWKKGMRLSTEVFNALDHYNEENLRISILAATGVRYGLIPSTKPFELTVSINSTLLEVISLNCQAVTKNGRLIDINFDSNFNSTFDSRIPFQAGNNTESYILAVRIHEQEYREVNEMYSEQTYTFELISENSHIGNDSLPIGLIVNQYGWRLNETDFVPPCLYVDSHHKYIDSLNRAKSHYKDIMEKCMNSDNCMARFLMSSVWSAVSSEFIRLDKERASITPDALLASLQKTVYSFVIGCKIEPYVNFESAEGFLDYSRIPYNARSIYKDIETGINLCAEISHKMDTVCSLTETYEPPVEKPKPRPTPPPAPEPIPIKKNKWEGLEI